MRKNIYLTLLISAAILISSCKKQVVLEEFTQDKLLNISNVPDSLQYLTKYLSKTRGVKISDIMFSSSDTSFIIEKDVFIYKKDVKLAIEIESGKISLNQSNLTLQQLFSLRRMAGRPDAIQQMQLVDSYSGNPCLVNDQFITNVKVKLNCSSPEWLNAAQIAITNYNLASLKTISKIKIRETYVGEGGNVNIYETGTTFSDPDVVADAESPHYAVSNGQFVMIPGSNVRIYNNHANMPLAQKVLAITHELGHIIGLAHTNSTRPNDIHISGTTTLDPSSFMHSSLVLGAFDGFTNNDLIALQTLYPKLIGNWQLLPNKGTTVNGGWGYEVFSTGNIPDSNGDYSLQQWNTNTNNWDILSSSYRGIKVSSGPAYFDGYFAWINSSHQIYRNASPSPILLPDGAIDIAQSGSNELYIVSTTPISGSSGNYMIKNWNGSVWTEIPSAGAVKIAAGANSGDLAIINSDGFVQIKDYNNPFFYAAGDVKATSIALNGSGLQKQLFIVTDIPEGPSGEYSIMRWTGHDWFKLPGSAKYIGTDNFGHPWIIKQNGDIYRNLSL